MKSLGRESHYSWDRPTRHPGRVMIQNYHGVRQVLENPGSFKSIWGDACAYVMAPYGDKFMLCGDTVFYSKQRETMSKALYKDQWHQHIKEFYEYISLDLLHRHTKKLAGINQIDITRDFGVSISCLTLFLGCFHKRER